MGVRSVEAEIRSLPVLAAILNLELPDLNLYSYVLFTKFSWCKVTRSGNMGTSGFG